VSDTQRNLFFDQPITDDDVLNVIGETRWMSYLQIAQKLGRRKTPSLIARVKSLAERNCLEYRFKKLPNGVDMHQFRIDPRCERTIST
jgi:hypothetical protein